MKTVSPFFLSVYGMLGKKALTVHGWVNGWIAIAVVRLLSPINCGARLPSPLHDWELDWDHVLVLVLAQ